MIKKEFKDVIKQALLLIPAPVILMSLVMTAIHTTPGSQASFADFFYPLLQATLLFFSLFLGISLFSIERRNRGMEYILSLPYSRMQLLIYKLVPRVAMLCLLYVIFLALLPLGGANRLFLTNLSFAFIYFILFIVSLYFSVASDNFVVSAMAGLMTLGIVLAVILWSYQLAHGMRGGEPWQVDGMALFHLEPHQNSLKFLTPVVIGLLLPFVIAFVISFKRVDMRPARQFNKKYFKLFVPMIIIALCLSLFLAYQGLGHEYRSFYLTSKMQLFENSYYTSKVYTREGVKKIDSYVGWWSAIETDNSLIDISWQRKDGNSVQRFDLTNFEVETLYQPKTTTKMGYRPFIYGNTLIFVEIQTQSSDTPGGYLVKLDLHTKKIERIKLSGGLHLGSRLIGADELDGEQFWLLAVRGRKDFTDHKGYIIHRIWDNGRQEELSRVRGNFAYLNHQLMTVDKRGLVFEKLTADGTEVIKVIPEGRILIMPMWWRRNLNNIPVKELYCESHIVSKRLNRKIKSKQIFVINLETLELKPLAKKDGYLRYVFPSHTYLMVYRKPKDPTVMGSLIELHQLSNGAIKLLKQFDPPVQLKGWGFYNNSGVVVQENKKIKVFALPDMKEVTFKKLK